jgi:hypothetical protein
MARLKDAASLAALEAPMPGGMPPMDPAAMGMAPPAEEMPGGDIESGIAMIEGALAGAPPDKAEEIRAHLNALREISATIGGEQAPPAEEPMPNPDEIPPVAEGV